MHCSTALGFDGHYFVIECTAYLLLRYYLTSYYSSGWEPKASLETICIRLWYLVASGDKDTRDTRISPVEWEIILPWALWMVVG